MSAATPSPGSSRARILSMISTRSGHGSPPNDVQFPAISNVVQITSVQAFWREPGYQLVVTNRDEDFDWNNTTQLRRIYNNNKQNSSIIGYKINIIYNLFLLKDHHHRFTNINIINCIASSHPIASHPIIRMDTLCLDGC